MTPEKPATGILKRNDWGDALTYQVVCECGDSQHDHNVWVEADDETKQVMVTTYVNVKSRWWEQTRWRTIWRLLTRGYVEHEATIIMTQQQALNYAGTLKQAVADLTKKG